MKTSGFQHSTQVQFEELESLGKPYYYHLLFYFIFFYFLPQFLHVTKLCSFAYPEMLPQLEGLVNAARETRRKRSAQMSTLPENHSYSIKVLGWAMMTTLGSPASAGVIKDSTMVEATNQEATKGRSLSSELIKSKAWDLRCVIRSWAQGPRLKLMRAWKLSGWIFGREVGLVNCLGGEHHH